MDNIPAPKAILFDLDGVLIDSEGIYTDFWSSVDAMFPTGIENFAIAIKGTTLPDILSRYFPDPAVQARINEMLICQELEMPYRTFNGTLEMLAALRAKGISTAIVTSSNRRKMARLFQAIPQLEQLTDTLVTDEDVTASKPDPQGYLLAATRLGADPARCWVVEDSKAGLRAGRAAGAFVIGIATTNPRSEIEPLADCVIDRAPMLTSII